MENDVPKEKQTDSKIHENQENLGNQNQNSSKKQQRKSADNFLLSDSMNQKYFPSKENYFGIKMSPEKKNLRSYSPNSHSPILNYFSNFSPEDDMVKNLYKNDNENSTKMRQNFEINPSNLFIKKSLTQNFSNINLEDRRTLQDKMAPYLRTGDSNNFIVKNNYQINNQNNNNPMDDEKEEEEEADEDEEDNEEAFTLTINNTFDKNNSESNRQSQEISAENKSFKKSYIEREDMKPNSNKSSKESQVTNTYKAIEFQPYIPKRFRDFPNLINYPENIIQNNNYYNQNNNYINISQNFNNFIAYNKINNQSDINIITEEPSNKLQNFYYKGDNYQINENKERQKEDYLKTGKIPSITPGDIVTTITSQNRVIKRINPNIYLNESIEFLAHNILQLAQDQAGCRFLQEKIDNDPGNTVKLFFKNIIKNIEPIIQDPFGNYLVQKLFPYLSEDDFKILLEKIGVFIFELGSSNHGMRVVQNLIDYLSTPELVNMFLDIIKPHIIYFLKEMNGMNIINKFNELHPEHSYVINKIIIDNCSILAKNKHGCFYLQKILEGPDNNLKSEIIKNLIDNTLSLIIDQFGNYVIQSILHLNNNTYSSEIALIIRDNAIYYSKHRYSCNVIEKCFDFCGKKETNILIEKLTTPEVIEELILDEYGNYVIQKALYYADDNKKDEILNIINTLIPKIEKTSFGVKLLGKLCSLYPQLNINNKNIGNYFQSDFRQMNYWYQNKIKKEFQKRNNYLNKFNNKDKDNYKTKNKYDLFFTDFKHNKDININNNTPFNNIFNINNNTININISSNIENEGKNDVNSKINIDTENKNKNEIDDIDIIPGLKQNKKKKKGKKNKKFYEEIEEYNNKK